jgi:hypothetical protein
VGAVSCSSRLVKPSFLKRETRSFWNPGWKTFSSDACGDGLPLIDGPRSPAHGGTEAGQAEKKKRKQKGKKKVDHATQDKRR